MATETKKVAEERLGTGIPKRGPSSWWSLWKPRLSLLDRSSGLWTNRQSFRRVYRVSSTQVSGLFQVSGLQVLSTCLSLNFVIGFFICSVGGAPQLSCSRGTTWRKEHNQPSDQHEPPREQLSPSLTPNPFETDTFVKCNKMNYEKHAVQRQTTCLMSFKPGKQMAQKLKLSLWLPHGLSRGLSGLPGTRQ